MRVWRIDLRNWMIAGLVTAAMVVSVSPASAAWPGQNGRIAFTRDPGTKKLDLWSARSNGADEQLMADAPYTEFEAAQSPTSKKIVYSAFIDGSYDICRLTFSGECHQLTDSAPWDRVPAFSPNGEKIVWVRDAELYKMNADGSGKRRLVNLPGTEYSPVWSPNGNRIAFERFRHGQADIYTMKPNGDGIRRITRSDVDDGSPDWHPTKNVLVWVRDDSSTFDDRDIVKKSLAPGSSLQFLTTSTQSEGNPSYSPNGRKIAYERFSGATDSFDVYVMNGNGTDEHAVIDSPDRDYDPYWLLADD